MALVNTISVTRARGRSATKVKSGVMPKSSRAAISTTTWMAKSTIDTPTTDRASSSRGKATFFTMPALPTTTAVAAMAAALNRFHTNRPANSQMAKCGWWFLAMILNTT